jgi:hypothetical protein
MIGLGWALGAGRRRRVIARYELPAELQASPAVARGGREVLEGLRDWLYVCHAGTLAAFVTVPSAAVADAWRDFSATAAYEDFCRRGFGELLLPAPAAAIEPHLRPEGVHRTWSIVCRKERIDPTRPDRLPRLFAVDEAVGHAPAIRWTLGEGEPPYRQEAGPPPEVVCAWPESPFSELLSRPFGAGMYQMGIPP